MKEGLFISMFMGKLNQHPLQKIQQIKEMLYIACSKEQLQIYRYNAIDWFLDNKYTICLKDEARLRASIQLALCTILLL